MLARQKLSVIVDGADTETVCARLAAHGVEAEVVATDSARNPVRSAALLAAFERTKGEFIFILPAGDAANVELLPRYLVEVAVRGADVVVGSKRHPDSVVAYPVRRRLLSWGYSLFVRFFIGLKLSDTRTGIGLFRRETLKYALERMLSKANAFNLELLAIAASRGAAIVEAPVVVGAGERFAMVGRSSLRAMVLDTLAVFYRLKVLDYYAQCLVPKRLDHAPLVSVVIACPRRSWMLDECLAGLRRQTYENWEAIVLPDEKAENAEGVVGCEKVRFVPTGKVRPAEKRNLGIREAKGEIVAFIDDDAYPEAHWLEYAVKYFGEPAIGAVGGPGVTPPGDLKLAKIGGRVYDNLLVSGNYRYRYKAGGVRRDVEDYPSCNLFVRKALLDEIGGYRTDFWPGEDTLLCKDIIDRWKRIIYEPWVVVYHHRRPLFLPHLRQLGRYAFHRGYFCKRYPSNSLRLAYFVPTAFVVYFAAYLLVVPLAVSSAGWALLLSLPLAAYFAAVIWTTAAFNPLVWLLTAFGVVLSHLTYGVRFVQGLLAAKAPCEFIGKDHA